jgi:hypothetical protein
MTPFFKKTVHGRGAFVARQLCLLVLLFGCLSAGAQAADSLRLILNESKSSKSDDLSVRLTFFSSEYVSSNQAFFREGAEGNNRGLSVGASLDKKWGSFGTRINGRNEYSATESWNYLNVYEANLFWQPDKARTVTLGRKLDRWNEWEANWRQGLFQPRYMLNKLRSEEAGLAGLFYNQNTRPVAFAVGFLPVHVPDLGSRFYVEDDKFVSRNPWFNPPAAQFEFREVIGDISYSLDKPTLAEAANHMGGVAKLEVNGVKNYFGRLAAAYKPMPQFLVGFPSSNRVFVSANDDFMSVRVTPRLAYHTLVSHDSIFTIGDWTMSGSITREVPDQDASSEDFTAQQVSSAWITSASVSRPLETEGPLALRMKLGFLKVDGGDAPDKGGFASSTSLFESRYQYKEAYSLGLSKPWRSFARFPLETQVRLVYDRLQNGGVASFSAGLNFTKEWRADLEVDFLGLLNGSAEIEDGFLALYRSNDRVGLGLSYVF